MSLLDCVNGDRRNLLARIGLSVGCRVSGAGGRSGSAAPFGRPYPLSCAAFDVHHHTYPMFWNIETPGCFGDKGG